MLNRLSINGEPYTLADESKLGIRRRTYIETMRPSQPSEAQINTKTWKVSGPIGNSRQQSFGEPLSTDYTENLDGRNLGLLTSVGARTQVTLTNSITNTTADPISDVTTTDWTSTAGNFWSVLDNYDTPNDADYASTSTDNSGYLILGLASQTDPEIDSNHTIRARITSPSGNANAVGVKLRLYDSTTVIATSNEITLEPVKAVSLLDAWTTGQDAVPTHTVSAGSNRLLVLVTTGDEDEGVDTNDLTAVTYGGQAMTAYGASTSTQGWGERRVEFWYLDEAGIAASSGTTLVPTWSQGVSPDDGVAYHLATFANVDQTTPITDDALDKDKVTMTLANLTVLNGDYVVAAAASGLSGLSSWTGQAGYTEQFDGLINESMHHLQDKAITADGTESVSVTLDYGLGFIEQAGMAIVIRGASAGAATTANISYAVPESAIATLSGYTALRIAISASTLTGSDVVRVTEMQLELPTLDINDVIGIDEQDGQLFAHRGDETTQINPGDMTEVEVQDHGSTITGSVAKWNDGGYVLFGSAKLVQKRTAVTSAGSTYANVTSVNASHAAVGPDRLWFVEADGGAGNHQVKYVVSAAWTDAAESNGIPVADETANNITGLYTLGDHMIAGTTRGPRSFTDQGSPAVLGEAAESFPSDQNGSQGASLWGWHYHGQKLGLYAYRLLPSGGAIENPVGPGEGLDGQRFEGPIDGFPIAVRAFKDSLWVSYLSTDGDSWLLRGVFGPQTDATGRPEWFVYRKLSGVECRAIGATTGRTVPALVWGENENVFYTDLAFRGREIAASGYTYGTGGGTWYGTTLMLTQGLRANVRWAKFYTEQCNLSNTWQLAVSPDEGSYIDVGSAVQTNGLQTVRPTSGGAPLETVGFTTLKPRLTQVAGSSTQPPQIRGDLVIAFDERPEHVREIDVLLELKNERELTDLQDLVETSALSPVAIRLPYDPEVNTDRYGYIRSAELYDRTNPSDTVAMVKIVEWPTL